MTIRIDKCKTFGIKKTVTRSVQFKPKLLLVREQVPTVDMDKVLSISAVGIISKWTMPSTKQTSYD